MKKEYKSIRAMRKMVASRTGMSKEDAEIAIRTVFDVVKQLMYEGYEVRVPNFVVFYLSRLKSRTIKMPKGSIFKDERFAPRIRFSHHFKVQVRAKKCIPVSTSDSAVLE